jgi:type II secretory pathway component GspD/PulD (secretin)
MVLVRDRAWKVRAAEVLFHDLMQPQAQIAIEIDIVSMDETKSKTWGLDLPSQFPLVSFGTLFNSLPANTITSSIPAGFTRFLTFGAGASFMGLGLASSTLFATASNAKATNILKAEVVTADGVEATFHVGDKYPIVTGSYSGATSSGNSYVPPPQFTFEDLGLILKIKPQVHGMDEMSLDVNAEFRLLGASSVDGIPIIGSRKLESKVRLVTGEWAVLAGLVTRNEVKAITGIPGLVSIPFLRKNTTQVDRSDTLIILKPHLLRLPGSEAITHTSWIGSETRARNF